MSERPSPPSPSVQVLGREGPSPGDPNAFPAIEGSVISARTPATHPPAPGPHTSNPARINRIGTDHVQVLIRPTFGDAELRTLVERIEQLVGAGFQTIDVAFEDDAAVPRDVGMALAEIGLDWVVTHQDTTPQHVTDTLADEHLRT